MNQMAPQHRPPIRLHVDVINTYSGFRALETAWKKLEDRDPEMTFFLSWDWLNQAFAENPNRWSVLAIYHPNDKTRLLGVLPLKYRVHWSSTRNEFQTEIEAAGRLIFSEYTGFLCEPRVESFAIQAMVRHLRTMPWSKLSLRYVAQHQRADLFCAAFERAGYPVTRKEYRINKGETDNLICPHVALPDDFETYLTSNISANTRQRYRRLQRRHLATGEYHFTHCDADSYAADIAILTGFWIEKWAPVKGKASAAKVAANFEKVLRFALETDALFLPILWRGETPLAALGHVMDPKMGAMHFIIAGRDTTAKEDFIGSALHFHSIECAILLGCQTYDFGHGDEAYKFSYGAEPIQTSYFSISRPESGPDTNFDPISTGAALKRIDGFIKAGKSKQARRACQQLAQLFK